MAPSPILCGKSVAPMMLELPWTASEPQITGIAGRPGATPGMRNGIVRREIRARECLRDQRADPPAVRAPTRGRREEAHHPPQVPGRGGTGLPDGVRNQAVQLVVAEGPREVRGQDADLRLLPGSEVLATTPAVCLDGFAARLHLADEDGKRGIIGKLGTVPLLQRVDTVQRHAERVAAQRVSRPHGGRHVVVEAVSKGHRRWLLSHRAPGRPSLGDEVAARRRLAFGSSGARDAGRGSGWNRRWMRTGWPAEPGRGLSAPPVPAANPAGGLPSCALLPSASASRWASRSARDGEPRREFRTAESSC